MKVVFLDQAWEDYLYWQNTDKAMLKKINSLVKEIDRTPFEGNGKPEPLRHNLAGWWSRRINLEHRIVYKIDYDAIVILQCRYHY
ncbi:Txe/YoeB family addiction module toxin [Mucilaginibacter sp. ZT4R22]|uniref:Putative mRNA interferase YoeB n=1 Tax=Mucilaginibacter pankratovii TaxID=2772110 RepID=A0ABR7WT68_9SPHI|nr:Txe/YoeB family addiction module toxin [Mucilaginibacter pankratovii]MBD1365503.1 Txe/YoeB family addiction module toxin [Mucilaginibacter pankratovii]